MVTAAPADDLAAGLAAYERGDFFRAHELWEERWLVASGPAREVLQALIQIAAALHGALHLGRRSGPAGTLAKALVRLDRAADGTFGLDLALLRRDVAAAIATCADPGAAPILVAPRLRRLSTSEGHGAAGDPP